MVRLRRGRPSAVPRWAAPLDEASYRELCGALDDALIPFGGYELGAGTVTVSGRASQYGLRVLIQRWVDADPPQRDQLVADHFAALFAAEDAERPSGAELLGLLRPRLYASETVARIGFPVLSRVIAADLEAVLCVDLPATVVNLRDADARATGHSIAELWEIAIAQIDDGLATETTDLGRGVSALSGDSLFVASRLIELERFVGRLGADGALVAVPHRHVLLWHRIGGDGSAVALAKLREAAGPMWRAGPGSISPGVYRWRAGRIEPA